ncbi:MAG TPA: DUF1987 domain-containing protein [Flavobacteriales bacterium]|nr:DUF1987 domain-containing protein [Flavobacteriales bacterium]
MERLQLEASPDTPKIILDSVKNIFEISQRSFPEDAMAFYYPVLNWVEEYKKNPNASTVLNINLEYYNTSSAKQLFKLFSLLEELSKSTEVLVRWHYKNEDGDMKVSGERFAKLFKVKFELVEH